MQQILYIFIILAYDFERIHENKISIINCSPRNEGEKLEQAKERCKNNNHCIGVFQTNCTDLGDSYVCLKNANSSSNTQTEGCFYKKFAIGQQFLKIVIHYKLYIIIVIFSYQYLSSYLINNKLDPCEKIICNGTNAQCQVYLGGKNEGKAFCACPQGFTGDPDFNCGKYV